MSLTTNIRVHARQLALQPHLQILRRSRRPLLCGMEQARRSSLAHHVHRTAPMGPRVLINGIWYKLRASPCLHGAGPSATACLRASRLCGAWAAPLDATHRIERLMQLIPHAVQSVTQGRVIRSRGKRRGRPISQFRRDGVNRSCPSRPEPMRGHPQGLLRTPRTPEGQRHSSTPQFGRSLCRDWWDSAGSPPYLRSRSVKRSAGAFSPATKG